MTHIIPCPVCKGTGETLNAVYPKESWIPCGMCGGNGAVTEHWTADEQGYPVHVYRKVKVEQQSDK